MATPPPCTFVKKPSPGASAVILPFPGMAKIKSPPPEDLPNRVREWRIKRAMILKDLAAEARLAIGHLSKIELGHRELNQETMDRLATGLGIDPADLLLLEKGGLSEEERLLVRARRQASPEGRRFIDAAATTALAFRPEAEVVELHPSSQLERTA